MKLPTNEGVTWLKKDGNKESQSWEFACLPSPQSQKTKTNEKKTEKDTTVFCSD
jgi:hypothetical protein